jgi:hypothetical protein
VVRRFAMVLVERSSISIDGQAMDPDLVDRIYESSLVPELWPGVLDELGRIAETPGGTLFITKGEVR